MRRAILAAALGLFAVLPASASASYHLIKITEVGNANPADYVELQMYAPGQNFVGGHYLRTYRGTGEEETTFQFPSSVPQGGNQRTILIGSDDPVSWPSQPDFTTSELMIGSDGAVCFLDTLILPPLDCVSFGGYMDTSNLPTGTPAPQIVAGMFSTDSLQRSIARGCATLLEPGDDTNDSAADFDLAAPTPRNNATAPSERVCDTTAPETTITKKPRKRSSKRRARFAFRSSERGSSFECKLDGGGFRPCESPLRERVGLGRHRFAVVSIDREGNRDRTPAKASFKRVRGR
jgi:hypothetical protein